MSRPYTVRRILAGELDRVDVRDFRELDGMILTDVIQSSKEQFQQLPEALAQSGVAGILGAHDDCTPVQGEAVRLELDDFLTIVALENYARQIGGAFEANLE